MKRIIAWIIKKMLKTVGITIFEENGIKFIYVDKDIHIKGGIWCERDSIEEATKTYYNNIKL